ncbi:GIY-YIG nuclease family protein [Spiroplasma endosymbiont of Amphibalanus improvisus]|uniref:GIY-YIG nuclease family protein n=1 Tax=Spiroplasma endosymbiont of Amphibalanus improvisus TaxID=3066327 RepID=UPI00313EDF99
MNNHKIKIYFSDQYPGIKLMEMTNSNIDLLLLPQEHTSYLKNEKAGNEYSKKAGIYILIGKNNDDGKKYAYIGQTKELLKRIEQHRKDVKIKDDFNLKQDFNYLIFISTINNLLGSTERFYIEKQLIESANLNSDFKVINENYGTHSNVNSKEAGVYNQFINNIKKLLIIIGEDIFQTKTNNIQEIIVNTKIIDDSITTTYNEKNKLYLKDSENNNYYA